MHPLVYDTLQIIRANCLLKDGDPVLVGVSGGPDSVALLHVLAGLAKYLSLDLTAVYVDHGLRPEETGAEAALVEKQSGVLGVGFKAGVIEVAGYAEERRISIEMAARDLRYNFLAETAERLGGAKIAVAHTADDQVEELLIRLLRGAGRNGLAGMAPENYRGVVRPFLTIPKTRLLEYLRDQAIGFLEDSSNTGREFLRNRVRLDLLPYLEEHFNPAIRETLLRTSKILGCEDELLDRLADEAWGRTVAKEEKREVVIVDPSRLMAEEVSLQRRVVEKILVDLGAPVSFQQVEKILVLAKDGNRGSELHLAEGLRVVDTASGLEFSYPAGRVRRRGCLLDDTEKKFSVAIDGPGQVAIDLLGIQLKVETLADIPSRSEIMKGQVDYLDMNEVSFPLTVRSFRPGDRFQPLGSPGSRKVADFLSDLKVPRAERWRVPVVESNGRIIALPGQRIDHRCRLRDTTAKVLKIEIVPL